jgi:hypothetical protein
LISGRNGLSAGRHTPNSVEVTCNTCLFVDDEKVEGIHARGGISTLEAHSVSCLESLGSDRSVVPFFNSGRLDEESICRVGCICNPVVFSAKASSAIFTLNGQPRGTSVRHHSHLLKGLAHPEINDVLNVS